MRYNIALFFLAVLAPAVWATPIQGEHNAIRQVTPSPPNPTPPCASGGVAVFVARGTDETDLADRTPTMVDPNYADIDGLAAVASAATSAGAHNSYYTAVPYPAYPDEGYFISIARGVVTTKNMITNYVNKCGADAKVVLIGYSQGAQVLSSALAGGDGVDGIEANATLVNAIAAGALFADPSRVYPNPVDAGNATTSGRNITRAKTEAQEVALGHYYSKTVRSYCAAGDFFCASGLEEGVHAEEVAIYSQAAINFIVPLIKTAT